MRPGREWDASVEARCARLVDAVCERDATSGARDGAWKELLVIAAPHVEAWAARSRVLRQAGLRTEDDIRAVLVAAVARLARDDFDNLRRWIARRPPSADDEIETDALERLARLSVAEAPDAADEDEDLVPSDERLPLRGWLVNLVRFVVKDHVKQRLGWAATGPSKRAVGTDAERLDAVPEAGDRPPITDLMAMRRLLDEVEAYVQTFPEAMRAALELWMHDASFEEIARRLDLEGPEAGRALARAAQARLRERFRSRWPDLQAVEG